MNVKPTGVSFDVAVVNGPLVMPISTLGVENMLWKGCGENVNKFISHLLKRLHDVMLVNLAGQEGQT